MKPQVLVIVGPTASGKSALAVELARRFNGEIISADSRQVYRGLDIGTGKITKREMRGIQHHLLDAASPSRVFSAADFVKHAGRAIEDISRRGKLPIVVGGTGFYVDALLGRIALPNVAPDKALRTRLAKKSSASLYTLLEKADPARAKALSSPSERNNKVRLIRAIEIARSQGTTKAISKGPLGQDFNALWIGIVPSDADLRSRINRRLKERIKKGMVREARSLHTQRVSYKRMRELGLEYRSLARHLQGDIDLATMAKELESDIWRYARKQIGYWKRNRDITWFDPKSSRISTAVRSWLKDPNARGKA
jgi:tRNA dimethylallyltransferase